MKDMRRIQKRNKKDKVGIVSDFVDGFGLCIFMPDLNYRPVFQIA
jgi:hypothetical protein